jgi:acetyl-CoA acetyltransferase
MGLMRDVAIVSFAQTPYQRRVRDRSEVEMLLGVVTRAIDDSGIPKREIGFTCSGSSDYIAGQAFAFVGAVDALGAWPPIAESHVEMDGAWALYEAWVKIQCGHADSALCFAFGRSSMGRLPQILSMQLDPYTLQPLGIDAISLAALQARALLDSGRSSEAEWAGIAARSRRDARSNPEAQLKGDFDAEKLLADPYLIAPLRVHDCPPISDGAVAVVIAADEVARRVCERPVWIRGIDHRIEPHQPGARDLTRSPSTRLAAEKAGALGAALDVAELHAPFAHQEVILRDALELGDSVRINPSGGPLAANPMMAAGLARIGEAARAIRSDEAELALAHATQGHCLQQNLVCLLEGD